MLLFFFRRGGGRIVPRLSPLEALKEKCFPGGHTTYFFPFFVFFSLIEEIMIDLLLSFPMVFHSFKYFYLWVCLSNPQWDGKVNGIIPGGEAYE